MAKVPVFLMNVIKDVPDSAFEKVLKSLKITEKDVFKKHIASHAASNTLYKDFVLSLFGLNKTAVASLYASIEGILFVGGCAPGVGIAFNIIDACFCFILGYWFGCLVAIISCFPIPGFKIAGKGLEKFFVAVLRRVSPQQLLRLTNKLGARLSKIGFHTNKSYMIIREQIENLIPEIHNPFAETIIRELSKIIKRFPVASRKVSETVGKTSQNLSGRYSIQPKQIGNAISPKTVHEGTQIIRRQYTVPGSGTVLPKNGNMKI